MVSALTLSSLSISNPSMHADAPDREGLLECLEVRLEQSGRVRLGQHGFDGPKVIDPLRRAADGDEHLADASPFLELRDLRGPGGDRGVAVRIELALADEQVAPENPVRRIRSIIVVHEVADFHGRECVQLPPDVEPEQDDGGKSAPLDVGDIVLQLAGPAHVPDVGRAVVSHESLLPVTPVACHRFNVRQNTGIPQPESDSETREANAPPPCCQQCQLRSLAVGGCRGNALSRTRRLRIFSLLRVGNLGHRSSRPSGSRSPASHIVASSVVCAL